MAERRLDRERYEHLSLGALAASGNGKAVEQALRQIEMDLAK